MVTRASRLAGTLPVVVSGGCFQNALLAESVQVEINARITDYDVLLVLGSLVAQITMLDAAEQTATDADEREALRQGAKVTGALIERVSASILASATETMPSELISVGTIH